MRARREAPKGSRGLRTQVWPGQETDPVGVGRPAPVCTDRLSAAPGAEGDAALLCLDSFSPSSRLDA